MPTVIAHAAAGIAAAGTVYREKWLFLVATAAAVCAVLPDADAAAFSLGIPYGDMLGHRGLSHSLFFSLISALLFTLICGAALKPGPAGAVLLFVCFFIAGASHGLLDAMTDGGLGVAFFAPFSGRRYFLPWRPIPVSPIGIDASRLGWVMRVLLYETTHIVLPALGGMALVRFGRRMLVRRPG